MKSSKVYVEIVHVPCEDTGELCYKLHFAGKAGSKFRLHLCFADFMFLSKLSSL